MFWSLSCAFLFFGDNVLSDLFKDYIITSLNTKDSLKYSYDVTFNHVRYKVKARCKLSYKIFEEKDGYYPFLEISPFSKLIPLTDFIGGIQNCVTVVGKWVFDRNIPFAIPLACDNMDKYCTNYYERRVNNGYKGVLKAIGFLPRDKISAMFRGKKDGNNI